MIQNKLWYLGDGVTLEQYFKKTAKWDVEKARFWAATAQGNVRKIHSGIVGTVVDRYKDIVLADLDAVDFGENMDILEERWNETTRSPGRMPALIIDSPRTRSAKNSPGRPPVSKVR